jgi:hypothetical protein
MFWQWCSLVEIIVNLKEFRDEPLIRLAQTVLPCENVWLTAETQVRAQIDHDKWLLGYELKLGWRENGIEFPELYQQEQM